MNFDDAPEEAKFRQQVRRWLVANAKPRSSNAVLSASRGDAGELARSRVWQGKKAAAGYASITWPKEYGGMGGTPMQAVIYSQEEEKFDVPQGFFRIGLLICLPTLMHFGRPEHKARYLRPALFGEEIWCQMFSEPSGGSDVAGARLRARQQPDGRWLLNGQKIWVSGAHYCDCGIVITRSDPSKPKHEGLTMFWIDLKTKGIEIKPIKQASGHSEFNEVYFDDVVVSDDQRLGEINGGWQVVVKTLMFERQALGAGYSMFAGWREVLDIAGRSDFCGRLAIEDGRVRERIADFYLSEQGLKLTNFQALTALSRGQIPGPEFSVGKLVGASMLQQVSYFIMDLMGKDALALSEIDPLEARIKYGWMWGAAARIAGGTDEIVRNILAERVLGLPPEIRVDKNRPFSELAG